MRSVIFFAIFFLMSVGSLAAVDGYLSDVDSEVSDKPVELVLTEPPDYFTGPTLNEKVFNHELSQEFIWQYQERFGRTEQESSYYMVNRQGYTTVDGVLVSQSQQDQARRDFATYMAKKLAEYHGENALKNDPQLKAVSNIKQTVSNVHVLQSPTYKMDMMYDFASNTIRAQFTSQVVNAYLISNPNDINFYLQKPIALHTTGEAGFQPNIRTFRVTVLRDISPTLSANFTQTLAMTQELSAIDPGRESISIAGLKLIF